MFGGEQAGGAADAAAGVEDVVGRGDVGGLEQRRGANAAQRVEVLE